MRRVIYMLIGILVLVSYCWGMVALANNQAANSQLQVNVPILTYHRFDPIVPGSMTINTAKFEAQLQWLKDNHYTVIPLKTLVSYLQGEGAPPPSRSVVITAEIGRASCRERVYVLV